MKNEKYTNHFNLAAPVSRLTKLSFCIASVCFAYSYQSDIPMVKPSLDYLQNFERTKVYEDSLDIIDGNGTTYMDCSASIKRTEDRQSLVLKITQVQLLKDVIFTELE